MSRNYTLQTYGQMDTLMVLFEMRDGESEFIGGDDDSGQDFNAKIIARLQRSRQYLVWKRLYYAMVQGNGAIVLY